MNKYLLGFRIEGAVKSADENKKYQFRNCIIWIAPPPSEKFSHFICYVELSGKSMAEAHTVASEVIEAFLDNISFLLKASLFSVNLWVGLKSKQGTKDREVYREVTLSAKQPPLILTSTESAGLSNLCTVTEKPDKKIMALRWLRYANRAHKWTEWFIYNWLAFEVMLGQEQINSVCGKCLTPLMCSTCKIGASRPATNKITAIEKLQKYNPEITKKEAESIWDTRNKLLHGGTLSIKLMRSVKDLVRKLTKATEGIVSDHYPRTPTPKPELPHRIDPRMYIGHFKFKTSTPEAEFAMDFPSDEELKLVHSTGILPTDGRFDLFVMPYEEQAKW